MQNFLLKSVSKHYLPELIARNGSSTYYQLMDQNERLSALDCKAVCSEL